MRISPLGAKIKKSSTYTHSTPRICSLPTSRMVQTWVSASFCLRWKVLPFTLAFSVLSFASLSSDHHFGLCRSPYTAFFNRQTTFRPTIPQSFHCLGGSTKISSPSGKGAFKHAPLTSSLLTSQPRSAAILAEMKIELGSACAVHRCAAGSNFWKLPAMQLLHFRPPSETCDQTFNMGNGLPRWFLMSSAVASTTACASRKLSCSAFPAKIHASKSLPVACRTTPGATTDFVASGPASC